MFCWQFRVGLAAKEDDEAEDAADDTEEAEKVLEGVDNGEVVGVSLTGVEDLLCLADTGRDPDKGGLVVKPPTVLAVKVPTS